MSRYLKEVTLPEQRITITQRKTSAADAMVVTAPLPDGFGLTVGSEFATPFDSGNVNSTLSKILTVANISQKASIRMKKMYSNPTPTEISFDMEFTSHYDAMSEVVLPAVQLMAMSLGRTLTWESLTESIEEITKAVTNVAGASMEMVGADKYIDKIQADVPKVESGEGNGEVLSENVSKVADLFNIIQGPPTVEVKFGNVMTLRECFITSVGTRFSNVLDINGKPTSAVCSVTVTPRQAPVMDELADYFGHKF